MMRFWLCAAVLFALIGLGLAACGGGPPASSPEVDYQQCQWGVGCTPQCTLKYGRSPYCDRG